MAITKIHAIKSTLGKALAYIENLDKTDGQMLVSGYNCEPQTASIDFEMTAVLAHKARNLKRKRSTNLAYHLIQSFSPEDAVTPEQAHELGKKLAFEYTGGKYEYVVATHIDKGHIHNHIMLNAVSFYDYKKLRTVPYRTARQMGYLICHHSGSLPCRYVGIPTAVVSGLTLNMAFSIYLPYRFSAIYFSAMWTATAPSATAVTT